MAVFKCKMCGGEIVIENEAQIATCEYCGSKQTIPSVDDEKKLRLFERANKLRLQCEFDKAYGVYESIVEEAPEEAEAYWGLVLCTYGIEYVKDPKTEKYIPTCHRSSFDSVMDDENLELALENANVVAKALYREQAIEIEEIRKGIVELSSKAEKYDIFICYKETDVNGERTIDSVLAQDVYTALTKEGYRVFFSRITLEDKLGVEYEPYIFSALHSSKVMLAFGTSYDNFHAVWVKNEWSRYLKLMEAGEEKALIPCFKNISAYDMPKEFARLQAQDLGKVGAIQDLVRGISKIISKANDTNQKEATSDSKLNGIISRGYIFLEDEEFSKADEYFDKALDEEPTNYKAYIGKALAVLKVHSYEEVLKIVEEKTSRRSFPEAVIKILSRAIKYAPSTEISNLESLIENIKNNHLFLYKIDPDKCVGCGLCAKYCPENAIVRTDYVAEGHKLASLKIIEEKCTKCDACLPLCSKYKAISNISEQQAIEEARRKKEEETRRKEEEELLAKFFKIERGELLKYIGTDAEVVIPSIVKRIGNYAFRNCTFITSVTIPTSVTDIEARAFEGCIRLTSVEITNRATYTGNRILKEWSELKSITIPDGATSIDEMMFYGCTSLTSITIPNNVTSIGKKAFYDCTGLTSITIPNSVTSIGESAFESCKSLTNVTMPNSVTRIGMYAFHGCTGLTSIELSNRVTSIGAWTFKNCTGLKSITIPNSVTSIGESAFEGCKNLASIEIPKSLTNIDRSAFCDCKFADERKASKVCIYCGGELKGFFIKTCSSCGRKKDY